MTSDEDLKPPRSLSRAAKAWWRRICDQFEMDSSGLMLLEQGLLAWDRLNQARALIKKEGLVVTTEATGAKHLHPAVRVEKESRTALVMCWRALNLDIEPPGPVGRPPGR